MPIKSSAQGDDAPVFFTPAPRGERLSKHGLESLEKFASELYDGRKREIRAALDEIWTIRDREISMHEWTQLRELRDDLARRGVTRFVDIVDRVIEILEVR